MKRPFEYLCSGNDSLLLVEARDELEVRYCREVPMLLDGRTWYFRIKQIEENHTPWNLTKAMFESGYIYICIHILYRILYTEYFPSWNALPAKWQMKVDRDSLCTICEFSYGDC